MNDQKLTSDHRTDADGNPTGGLSSATGMVIKWQDGPLGRGDERLEPNGCFVETVIRAAKDRLEYYQRSPLAGEENADAIVYLEYALETLAVRTARRVGAGVEGTYEGG